jgi:hypothetical protein
MLRSAARRFRMSARRGAEYEQISGDYTKCKGGPHPPPSGTMMDFFFQTSYPLKYRIGGTLGGIFIAVSAFGPTWAIPFNRYWVNVYRENGKKGPTAYGAGKGYAWN